MNSVELCGIIIFRCHKFNILQMHRNIFSPTWLDTKIKLVDVGGRISKAVCSPNEQKSFAAPAIV